MAHHGWFARAGNGLGVWLYRRFDGRLSSSGKDVHVLLLTVPGRRSGLPRSVCVRYLEAAGGLVVWGTGSGSRRDPDWFENLRRVEVAEVQVGARAFRVAPRELVGSEHGEVWQGVILAQAPEVARYAERAGRVIPVAVLVAAA
ncbi:nitroreductase family deazaflavin-dependent oxidoreductase [Actinotalea sp. M2MS4P-6]|uniref:nitroreductase family deazaflavin-dependent oxidoreductase n=1 Tax=Actinotalea sp. M2MS4P-6 TaxID=2983762 RepID=UPI0021E4D1D7|nr:nitroreductase family deazaflavin-dependent oxidoreductase [Actinotalea sp. M2MS4P-6]MCV2395742.1 nitroreductase family deazaflavin-dependent oxidoreductase [Actinotalea sp. M2MS4P-6]